MFFFEYHFVCFSEFPTTLLDSTVASVGISHMLCSYIHSQNTCGYDTSVQESTCFPFSIMSKQQQLNTEKVALILLYQFLYTLKTTATTPHNLYDQHVEPNKSNKYHHHLLPFTVEGKSQIFCAQNTSIFQRQYISMLSMK